MCWKSNADCIWHVEILFHKETVSDNRQATSPLWVESTNRISQLLAARYPQCQSSKWKVSMGVLAWNPQVMGLCLQMAPQCYPQAQIMLVDRVENGWTSGQKTQNKMSLNDGITFSSITLAMRWERPYIRTVVWHRSQQNIIFVLSRENSSWFESWGNFQEFSWVLAHWNQCRRHLGWRNRCMHPSFWKELWQIHTCVVSLPRKNSSFLLRTAQ